MDTDSLLLYLFFLLCSAYFAASETAYTAVSRVRLRTLADKGNKRAKRALWICDRFDKTLTTVLIGNNIFHASCASLSALLVIQQFSEQYVVYGTLLTTIIVYLFAEMLPKSLAKVRSEEIALLFSFSMMCLIRLMTPVSFMFSGISAILSKVFKADNNDAMTEEDLINIIETIEDEGVLEPEKQALVNSAMEFGTKLAEDIMIPIEEVVSVPATMPMDQLAEYVKTLSHSRLPVYEGSKDNIVGILPVNIFMTRYVMKKPFLMRKILIKPYVFDRKTEVPQLLQRMRLNKLHMVFICDENRRKLGVITMEDILEELVGDIQDESDAGEGLQLM